MRNVSIVRDNVTVLDSINLTIQVGEHTAILGPNGCGKSTLIRALTRELYPYGGRGMVRVCGRERWVISELRTLIGVVSEEPKAQLLGSPTGLDLAVSGLLGSYGVTKQHHLTPSMWNEAHVALERVHASHLAGQTVETMSTGERRRVWIARALISKPKALILDEPTNGLDMRASHEFLAAVERLAESGVTIVLVTHHMEEILPCIHRILLMSDGAVLADGTRDKVLTLPLLQRAFQIRDESLARALTGKLKDLAARQNELSNDKANNAPIQASA